MLSRIYWALWRQLLSPYYTKLLSPYYTYYSTLIRQHLPCYTRYISMLNLPHPLIEVAYHSLVSSKLTKALHANTLKFPQGHKLSFLPSYLLPGLLSGRDGFLHGFAKVIYVLGEVLLNGEINYPDNVRKYTFFVSKLLDGRNESGGRGLRPLILLYIFVIYKGRGFIYPLLSRRRWSSDRNLGLCLSR